MTHEIDDAGRLTVVRQFEAVLQAVFDAFTDPEKAAGWMWGGLGSNPRAEIDLRVGGHYRIAIKPPKGQAGWVDGEDAMSGVYVEVDPPKRLVYTLHWEADVGYNRNGADVSDEVIIVDLSSVDEGTKLNFRHLGIPNDGVSAAEHGRAAEAMFDLLAEVLDR